MPEQPPSPLRSRAQPELKLTPAPPADRKAAAREAVIEAAFNVKAIAQEFIDDFQASDKYFKYKAGVLSGWVAMSLLTLALACPSASQGPSNSLSAEVKVSQVATLESSRSVLLIQNKSADPWSEVRLTLNGSYTTALPAVVAHGKAVIEVRKFIGADGNPPPTEMKPTRLEIRTLSGETSVDLSDAP